MLVSYLKHHLYTLIPFQQRNGAATVVAVTHTLSCERTGALEFQKHLTERFLELVDDCTTKP